MSGKLGQGRTYEFGECGLQHNVDGTCHICDRDLEDILHDPNPPSLQLATVVDAQGEHRVEEVALPEGGFQVILPQETEGGLTDAEWEEQAAIHRATLGY